ncbi:hypothetical protein P7K49_039786 [Saguinus oedipus]|uniref:Uncharacterized protein n=1 Tax=Saguinus oedipus TaxID=9490 RepID=A0ABQ9TD28_SAGOE|nr:hypothetical protein P7K49_039786 [Saguinus oedipus]
MHPYPDPHKDCGTGLPQRTLDNCKDHAPHTATTSGIMNNPLRHPDPCWDSRPVLRPWMGTADDLRLMETPSGNPRAPQNPHPDPYQGQAEPHKGPQTQIYQVQAENPTRPLTQTLTRAKAKTYKDPPPRLTRDRLNCTRSPHPDS